MFSINSQISVFYYKKLYLESLYHLVSEGLLASWQDGT